MSHSDTIATDTGLDLYAKPIVFPGVFATPWGDDDITGTEIGTSGVYLFEGLADDKDYHIFEQAGASPADTDTIVGTLGKVLATATNVDDAETAILAAISEIEVGGGTIQIQTSGTNVSSNE